MQNNQYGKNQNGLSRTRQSREDQQWSDASSRGEFSDSDRSRDQDDERGSQRGYRGSDLRSWQNDDERSSGSSTGGGS